MSLSAVSRIFCPWQIPLASISSRDSNLNSPRQTYFSARASSSMGTPVRKPKAADIDAEHRRGGTGDVAGDAQHRAVAAKDQKQIHFARERGGVAVQRTALRPARWMSRAALRMISAQAALFGIADKPDALDFVSFRFFNQHQKFFVARRTEQRRFKHIPPAKSLCAATKSCSSSNTRSWMAASVMTPGLCPLRPCPPQIAV